MSKHYADLIGAEGRAQLFRPARVAAESMFGATPPLLHFDDEVFTLADLSVSGAGGATTQAIDETTGAPVLRRGVLKLTQRGREIFAAPARRARINHEAGRTVVGFAIDGAALDFEFLKRANALALARASASKVSSSSVPAAYKEFCADVCDYVGQFRALIERDIAPVEHLMQPAEMDAAARDLAAAATSGWVRLVQQGNALVAPFQRRKEERLQLKAFTERVVLPLLLEGEGFSRTYRKPLGYPGDFQIMNYIYDGAPIGRTVRQQFLHLLSLIGAEPVNTRKQRLVEILADCAAVAGDQPVHVMSIGAGPAREIGPLLDATPNTQWRFTLVDQETLALEDACMRARALGTGGRLSVQALHASFRDMLDPAALGPRIARQHIVYSSGLVDYLSPLMARRLVGRLYQMVEPGGAVIIGNVNNAATGMMWPSEYLVDWTLYFRDAEEMRAMAEETSGAAVSILEDSARAIYFLVVTKPR